MSINKTTGTNIDPRWVTDGKVSLNENMKEFVKAEIGGGTYGAEIIGWVSQITQYQSNEPKLTYKLLMQILDDKGAPTIVATTNFSPYIVEKENSKLFKWLSSWLKKSTKDEIIAVLKDKGFYEGNDLMFDNFIGKKPSLLITLKADKKDSSKMYPKIENLMPIKKQLEIEITPIEVPAWMVKDAVQIALAEGFTIAKPFKKKLEGMEEINTEETSDDSLPF